MFQVFPLSKNTVQVHTPYTVMSVYIDFTKSTKVSNPTSNFPHIPSIPKQTKLLQMSMYEADQLTVENKKMMQHDGALCLSVPRAVVVFVLVLGSRACE